MSDNPDNASSDRRTFLTRAATVTMAGGLIAGYGTFGIVAARYLQPARERPERWMFVARTADIGPGSAREYTAPSGETIAVARQGNHHGLASFIALSNICPHLGCKVAWEAGQNRFFCPCHNGVFDAQGKGVSGPPGQAGQSLARFPLEIAEGLIYIRVPVDKITAADKADLRRLATCSGSVSARKVG